MSVLPTEPMPGPTRSLAQKALSMIPYSAVDALRSMRRTFDFPLPANSTPHRPRPWVRLATLARSQSGTVRKIAGAGESAPYQERNHRVDTQPGA